MSRPRPTKAAVSVSVVRGPSAESLGIKPLTWFHDHKGSKADCKVLFVKMAQTPSNKYLKVLARCTISQKEMELLVWNDDKKDIDCGAVVSTLNDPEKPYEFVVRNVYAKEADARYKTNWTETQLHFNHDVSHLFYNDELIEFTSSTAPAPKRTCIQVLPSTARQCSECKEGTTPVCGVTSLLHANRCKDCNFWLDDGMACRGKEGVSHKDLLKEWHMARLANPGPSTTEGQSPSPNKVPDPLWS